jgi:hypothetical protein
MCVIQIDRRGFFQQTHKVRTKKKRKRKMFYIGRRNFKETYYRKKGKEKHKRQTNKKLKGIRM